MFDNLSERLGGILDRLTVRSALSEADVDAALREVRRALLEADVALDVTRSFVEQVKKNAVGVALIKSVKPGQMVVKLVHDQLVETLGASADPIDLNAVAPVGIMMVGLQGSGKTTTTAKIAKREHLPVQRRRVGAGEVGGAAGVDVEIAAAGALEPVLQLLDGRVVVGRGDDRPLLHDGGIVEPVAA